MSTRRPAFLGAVAFPLVVVLFLGLCGCRRNGHSLAEHARLDARLLAISLAGYATDFPDGATNAAENAYRLFDTLCGASNAYGVTYLDAPERWTAHGQCVDGWGNPFHARIVYEPAATMETIIVRVRVWSNGPNQIDDGGMGDDVAFERYVGGPDGGGPGTDGVR